MILPKLRNDFVVRLHKNVYDITGIISNNYNVMM